MTYVRRGIEHASGTFCTAQQSHEPDLPWADAGQVLQAVTYDLAAEAVALDVEQAGGIGLIAAR